MPFTAHSKQYALLVGVDFYLNDGTRKDEKGKSLSLANLRGCVNDVHAIKALLQSEWQLEDPRVLTASLPSGIPATSIPLEPPSMWPTFANIKREFDTILEQAQAGDRFFFHFSGHGSQLPPTRKSPAGRAVDPSLITVDFCQGGPAVRGWQLNEWLRKFNEKNVQVLVLLDSCYSGGGWRDGDTFRTTEDWTKIPTTDADEEATSGSLSGKAYRDGVLPISWAINPEGFTLMAACESHERAMEMEVDDTRHGAFTYELLACLERSPPSKIPITYRSLRDHVAKELGRQTPRVYGRDGLLFFGDTEPVSLRPLVAQVEGGNAILPLGKFHGVYEASEFITFQSSRLRLSVTEVDDFQCTAAVTFREATLLEQLRCEVIPSRWSLGDQTLRVSIDCDLGSCRFKNTLSMALQDTVVGKIEISQLPLDDGKNAALKFRLGRGDDGTVGIFGSSSLIGYDDPVRGINFGHENTDLLAKQTATILGHLARFSQILDLHKLSSSEPGAFELEVRREGHGNSLLDIGKKVKFKLVNTSGDRLFFSILVLGPGFDVRQLYPTGDSPASLEPGKAIAFSFKIVIPDEIKKHYEHRDIIRTIITEGNSVLWKNIELPHVWKADQLERQRSSGSLERDAMLSMEPSVWIQDTVILTRT